MKNDRTIYIAAALVAAVVIAAYANHFYNGFHFDDTHTIVNNIYIRDIRNIPLFFTDAATSSSLPANQAYRPIVTATTAIDFWMGKGLYPLYFHLSVFILFMVQGILMYFLYLRIFNLAEEHAGNRFLALFAAGWYLLHPANAETINYMLARSDSISTLFVVLAFVLFLYSPLCRKWHLYLIPVALGGLTKPTAVMFGPLLFAYVLLFEGEIDLRKPFSKESSARLISSVKTASIALLFCACLFAFIRSMDSPHWVPGGTSRFQYLITQPYVVLHYVITFFLPITLSADTDWTTLKTVLDVRFFIGLASLVIFLWAALVLSKKRKFYPISFGILWFFISLIPTSTVIPLAEVMNDHRLFFPYIGLMMSVCWSLHLFLENAKRSFSSEIFFYRSVAVVLLIVLVFYAYGTRERNKVWETDESLWYDVTQKSPKNGRGLMNYGLALMSRADYTGAEKYFTAALQLYPYYSYLYINMGILKQETGRVHEAERDFKIAMELDPGNPSCYFFYAKFLNTSKRFDAAVQNLTKTLKLAPTHLDARHLLMSIYYERKQLGELRELAEQTMQIAPGDKQTAYYISAMQGEKTDPDLTKEALRNRAPESPGVRLK